MTSEAVLLEPPTSSLSSTLRAVQPPRGYHYLLSVPPAHGADLQRRWPLLLFLHGTAGWGNNVWAVTVHGLPRLLAGAPDLNAVEQTVARRVAGQFIVVAPQCPFWEVWEEAAVLALLDAVAAEFRVDTGRVYLTGLSLGGFGAWSIGLRHLERFAALVPVCGGGRVADVAQAAQRHPAALARLGVWAFHGARDETVPLEESTRMVQALQQAGVGEARLTVYPEADHDAWTPTYANAGLYDWLLHPRG